MTNSNSQLTLEQRLINKLKVQDTLCQLLTDEDLIDVARKAVHESLLQYRTNRDGYRNNQSPAVIAAHSISDKIFEKVADELFNDPEIKKLYIEMIMDTIPVALALSFSKRYTELVDQLRAETHYNIEKIKSKCNII